MSMFSNAMASIRSSLRPVRRMLSQRNAASLASRIAYSRSWGTRGAIAGTALGGASGAMMSDDGHTKRGFFKGAFLGAGIGALGGVGVRKMGWRHAPGGTLHMGKAYRDGVAAVTGSNGWENGFKESFRTAHWNNVKSQYGDWFNRRG